MVVKMLKTGLILTLFNFYLGILQTSPKSLRLSMKQIPFIIFNLKVHYTNLEHSYFAYSDSL
jgi:hypothetical protein